MKLYTPIQGPIKQMDADGTGVFDVPGRKMKAQFAFPGDVIAGTTVRRGKGETFARIDSIVTPSADRVVPRCPYVGTCGGCVWQALNYPKQLDYKRDLVNACFEKSSLPYRLASVMPSRDLFYYRNRMDFVFGPNGELGMKEPGKWFSYLDLSSCFLLSPESVELMSRVRAWAKQHALAPYIPKTGTGFLRYLVIREGKHSGERVAHLLTTSQAELPSDLVSVIGDLATHIVHGVNDGITDLSTAEKNTVLKGADHFHETANGVSYSIPIGSFFQTNTVMAEELFRTVTAACAGAKDVLDLYCGVGFFALGLAKAGVTTHGVEIDPNAILAAQETARANHLTQATFVAAKSEDLSWKTLQADVVIIDPPRAGLHPKVITSLLEMAPQRIIYISCKYSRFIEELPKFLTQYSVTSTQAFDFFPHTPHLELVTILDKTS